MSILKILEEIAATPSRNEKEAILKREEKNLLLKNVIVAALDPMKNYWIKKIPPYSAEDGEVQSLGWGVCQLDDLTNRTFTGNAGINFLATVLSKLSSDDAKVIERIIGKDLKIGASGSTMNKIWPKLISEYPVQLCEQLDPKLAAKISMPAFVQKKEDGGRFNAHVDGKTVEYISRNGKPVELHGVLDAYFLGLYEKIVDHNNEKYVFDGELLYLIDGEYAPREVGNGYFNKAIRGTLTVLEAQGFAAILWDVIPYNDFIKGRCEIKYRDRFEFLVSIYRAAVELAAHNGLNFDIMLVPTIEVESHDQVQPLYEIAISKGHEGIILKDPTGPWESKRVKHQIKYKAENEADLLCTGTYKGEPGSKYENCIGGLIFESADPDDSPKKIRTKCGSGLSDAQRNMDPSEFVGKVHALFYNTKIQDKTTKLWSLFLPIYRHVREDKDVANSAQELK